jgi:hypothetical protein
MKMAAELMAKTDEEIDIEHLRTLVATTMQQQSKADTSRRLESNPEACVSTSQKNASDREHRDDQSRIGSTERRRKTKEHPNPIPIPSDIPPAGKNKGKDAMYASKDKNRNPSPPWNQHAPPPPRRRSPAGNARPHGPGGINIRDNVEPTRNRNEECAPEPRRIQNEEHTREARQSRNDGGSRRDGEDTTADGGMR